MVSIHAPVKSATGSTKLFSSAFVRFNPRARKERDDIANAQIDATIKFQSTRP